MSVIRLSIVRRMLVAVSLMLLVVGSIGSAYPAAAMPVPPISATPVDTTQAPTQLADMGTGPPLNDPNAKAIIYWSVPDRYNQSWAAWNPNTARYDDNGENFVNPTQWAVDIHGCQSSPKGKIRKYSFKLSGIGYTKQVDSTNCNLHISASELKPGSKYVVELVVHTAAGESTPAKETIQFQDWLIVSLGDSLASGEGNPDKNGAYYYADCSVITATYNTCMAARNEREGGLKPADEYIPATSAIWKDIRCHRSALSGHARYAQQLEQSDAHSSVTFLSFACSGAGIEDLVNNRYKGIVTKQVDSTGHVTAVPGPANLLPQIEALEAAIGSERPIHALLLSVGINELGVDDTISACSTNLNQDVWIIGWYWGDDRSCLSSIPARLGQLNSKFLELSQSLEKSPLTIMEVYISDYPTDVFHGGACGRIAFPGLAITAEQGRRMNEFGILLSKEIQAAASRYHWNFVPGMLPAFNNHEYCASIGNSYFVKYGDSFKYQGNKKGTAHPNDRGHKAIAQLFNRSVVLRNSFSPYRHVKVLIDAVKLPRDLQGWSMVGNRNLARVDFGLKIQGMAIRKVYPVAKNGEWVNVLDDRLSFEWDLYLEPVPPRYPTGVNFTVQIDLVRDATRDPNEPAVIGKIIKQPVSYWRGDSYGVGAHEIPGTNTTIGIRYHVELAGLPRPPGSEPEAQPQR